MRSKLVTIIACCAAFGGPSALAVVSADSAAATTAPAHEASCVYGKIGGVRKCLRAGEYCARRYQRQYLRYGFSCDHLDYRGDWHLEYA